MCAYRTCLLGIFEVGKLYGLQSFLYHILITEASAYVEQNEHSFYHTVLELFLRLNPTRGEPKSSQVFTTPSIFAPSAPDDCDLEM